MKITGSQIIESIAKRLGEEGKRCYDSAIVFKLNSLTAPELAQLTDFGDVIAWHNERIDAAMSRARETEAEG